MTKPVIVVLLIHVQWAGPWRPIWICRKSQLKNFVHTSWKISFYAYIITHLHGVCIICHLTIDLIICYNTYTMALFAVERINSTRQYTWKKTFLVETSNSQSYPKMFPTGMSNRSQIFINLSNKKDNFISSFKIW